MNNLVPQGSLFQGLFEFRRDFEQIFNRMLNGGSSGEVLGGSSRSFAPAVESYVDKDGRTFHCRISLPGIDPKDVQVHAQGNALTISGERKVTHSFKDVNLIHNEIWYGSFERTLPLPEGVDANRLNAEYRDGLLQITAPISSAALPRRIEVKTAPVSKQMSA